MAIGFRLIDFNYVWDSSVTITASSENVNFPATNLRSFTRAQAWRTASATLSANVVFDLQTAEEIDSFGLIFDPLVTNKFTPSAIIKLQANATNVWTSPSVDVTLTLDSNNNTYTHFFTTPEEYRYWRVTFSDVTNPYNYLEIHKIFLGRKLDFDRAIPQTGFTYQLNSLTKVNKTPYGHYYADLYPDLKIFKFDWDFLSYEDIQKLQESFKSYGNYSPVLLVIDAVEELFDKDHTTIYGIMRGDLTAKQALLNIFNAPLTIEEVL